MSGVQIARTALPANKPVYQALASIFGIGVARGLEISETCGISKGMRVRDLKQHQVKRVSEYIQDNFTVGDNLKRELRENILTMIRLQTWRGTRHEKGLSIHARSTQTNNKTAKKLKHHHMYDTSK